MLYGRLRLEEIMAELSSQEEVELYNKEQEDWLNNHPEIKQHLQEIEAWLDKNVEKHPPCSEITLLNFELEVLRQEIQGSFALLFGEFKCGHRIRFSFGENGKVSMGMPMFHSPLGAPCSYGAIEVSHAEEKAVNHVLNYIFPRIKPYGICRETGDEIRLGTAVEDRMIDGIGFINAKEKVLSPNYAVTVKTDGYEIQESFYETSKPIW